MSDKESKVEVPPMVEPMLADEVQSDETCPICDEDFVHVTDAPVSINKIDGRTCLTSFGVVFFH